MRWPSTWEALRRLPDLHGGLQERQRDAARRAMARVLDLETGDFPNVRRTFVPVACMHCADPPACTSADNGDEQRDDGLVTIDYDICIGCANCVMACPYDAF